MTFRTLICISVLLVCLTMNKTTQTLHKSTGAPNSNSFKGMQWCEGGRGQKGPLIIITAERPWPVRLDSARQPNQKTHLLLAFTSNEPANGDKWTLFAQLAHLMALLISTGRSRSDGDEEAEKMGTPGVRRVRALAP